MNLRELYQQVILDHNKHPRNFEKLDFATRTAHGDNPFCGDTITVYLNLDDGAITDITFQGQGCAISKASASLMTEALKGKSLDEAEKMFDRFQKMITSDSSFPIDTAEFGKLASLAGVREFPIRVKCASLPWHTLKAALEHKVKAVTTE